MNIHYVDANGYKIAFIEGDDGEKVIRDVASALDLMATVRNGAECDRIAIPKSAIEEGFFTLSNGMAGEILQKYVNYQCKLAIYGCFEGYTSKPLRDFIYESNKGRHVYFVADQDEAIEKLVR